MVKIVPDIGGKGEGQRLCQLQHFQQKIHLIREN